MRRIGFVRLTRLLTPACLLCGLVFLLALSPVATAQAPSEVHVTAPAPLGGAGHVVLTSQTVDVRLTVDESGRLWAEVEARTKLHNTSKTSAASVVFGWPGWSGGAVAFAPESGENGQFTRDGKPLFPSPQPVQTTWGQETRTVTWWTTEQPIARDARATFSVSWRQLLEDSPLITVRVGLLPAGRWPGTVGGVRVTVHLPALGAQEQIVQATPAEGLTFDGYRVEWVLAEFEPQTNLELRLISPTFWREIVEWRRRTAEDPSDAEAWLQLADRYAALAAAGVPAYDSLAEAALLKARDAAPSNPEPHRRLWERYRLQVGDPPDPAALQQATEAAEAYVLTGGTETAVRAYAVQGLLQLAELWLAQQVPGKALELVERAARLAGPDEYAAVQAAREQAAGQDVLLTLQAEGLEAALARAYDLGLLAEKIPLPWARHSRILVHTQPDRRTVVVEWVNPLLPETFAAQLRRLESQLTQRAPPGVTVTRAVEGAVVRLTIEMPGPPDTWPAQMAQLEAALPADENVDLLRSVLRPPALEWQAETAWLQVRFAYREAVTLQSRASARAEALRQQAQASGAEWERALLEEAATAWDRLAAAQEAIYTVRVNLGGRTVQSSWALRPPVARELLFEEAVPRADRIALLIAGGMGLLLLVLALIWRWPVRG